MQIKQQVKKQVEGIIGMFGKMLELKFGFHIALNDDHIWRELAVIKRRTEQKEKALARSRGAHYKGCLATIFERERSQNRTREIVCVCYPRKPQHTLRS